MTLLCSKESMINKYHQLIIEYENAICEMEEFIPSDFVKENNIGIFLLHHVKFAKNAKAILEETVVAIETGNVKKDICMRLEKMIKVCRKEHVDIEDTYSRIRHENSRDYYCFEGRLMNFRAICDELEYLDETIEEIKSMVDDNGSKIVVNNSKNIQIGTESSNILIQEIYGESINVGQVKDILNLIEENLKNIKLNNEKNAEITSQVEIIKTQLTFEKPKREVIIECFNTMKAILEGVAGSIVASGLIYQIGLFK